MAAPTYTNDLTTVDQAEATTNWAESTDANWDDGGPPTSDADYPYIQTGAGNGAISQQMTKTGLCSLFVNNGSGITLPTDGAYLVWQVYSSNLGIQTYANGGLRVMVGSGLADFESWDVGGSDFGKFPYGGWQNHAVNSTVTPDDTVGTPSGTEQYIGAGVNTTTGIGKGNPHAVDVVRYGRCSSIFENGDSGGGGPAVFSGFATLNDASTARWGLLQETDYGFLWKGKLTLGSSGTAVYFRDSNVFILLDATPKVTSSFNTIEVNNASSDIVLTNVSIKSLSTASPGRLVCNANASFVLESCTFENMSGTWTFGGTNSAATNCVFRGAGQILPKGGDMTGTRITGYEGTADTGALNWDVATATAGLLDDMTFVKGTASTHAMEFDATNSPTTINLSGHSYSGYNASNGQTDSTILIRRTTGTVTINVSAGDTPSYKSLGATVSVVSSTTVTLTGLVANTEVRVYDTSDDSVVDGVENSGTSFAFSYTSGENVYIRIFHIDYLPADITNFTIPASNTSLPIQQIFDRNFNNP